VKTTVGKMGLPPTEDNSILPSDLPNPSNQTTSVAESAEKTPPRTVPPTCPGPAESRLVPSAIGGVPAWFVDHAEHISRCHPPSLVPPTCPGATHLPRCHPPWNINTVPGTQFGQRADCAVSGVGCFVRHRVPRIRRPVTMHFADAGSILEHRSAKLHDSTLLF